MWASGQSTFRKRIELLRRRLIICFRCLKNTSDKSTAHCCCFYVSKQPVWIHHCICVQIVGGLMFSSDKSSVVPLRQYNFIQLFIYVIIINRRTHGRSNQVNQIGWNEVRLTGIVPIENRWPAATPCEISGTVLFPYRSPSHRTNLRGGGNSTIRSSWSIKLLGRFRVFSDLLKFPQNQTEIQFGNLMIRDKTRSSGKLVFSDFEDWAVCRGNVIPIRQVVRI